MNPQDDKNYNPADDDNQGVAQLMAQHSEATTGVAQAKYMNPLTATAQGTETEKAEVNDRSTHADGAAHRPTDVDTAGVNDDMLAEENVENGTIEETEIDG